MDLTNNTNSICVTSYNSGGMGIDKQNYIKTLQLFSDIICVQEHFLLDSGDKKHSNTQKLKQYFGDSHDMYIKPAYKSSETVKRGRGSGGLILMWNKKLTKYVTNVECESYRLQAAKFTFPEAELLLINAYFMVDTQNNNFNDNELYSLLAEIEGIINVSVCRNVVLVGDINCDFARNSAFVNIVKNFINQNNLKIFWSNPDENPEHLIGNINYTYSNTVENVTHASIIDHFIANDRVFYSVTEANVIDSPDNHSGHLPIYFKVNIGKLNVEVEEQLHIPRPSWNKASDQQKIEYKQGLQENLLLLNSPEICEMCASMKCQHHSLQVDEYALAICESLDSAARSHLPMSGSSRKAGQSPAVPGWNEYVKPFQDESKFWNGLWKAAGSPQYGDLYNNQMSSKMQYKYAIRRLKRASSRIQENKFVESLLAGGANIFKEIKKFRGQSKDISTTVDGVTCSSDISDHFAEIYSELYSRHNLGPEFAEINQQINDSINHKLQSLLDRVNYDNVKAALNKLKSGKSDSTYGFTSDCLINSSDTLINHCVSLFKWFLRTGKIPASLLLCTLIPIVKDNLGDITSSDNYRAIAIGNLLLKWFDWLILILEEDKLSTDELQFGFQAKSSTSMCSWAVSAVVDHYNQAGRPVFACAMDLSKAFDLVAWDKMFSELSQRGISPLILRCLLYMYTNQKCNVKWGNTLSNTFDVKNGVRQGAVSSPILFCIYINKLIKTLRKSSIGCQIQGVYLGIWVYADDIILLSPSRSGLQQMVKLCENFASLYKLKFSTNVVEAKSKTKCIIFSKDAVNVHGFYPIILNALPLPFVNEVKHIGNLLETNNLMKRDISIKRAKFISKINSLNQEFHFSSPAFVVKLYKIYACSFHGSCSWDLYSDSVNKLYTSWNIAIRILFELPRNTHRYFIEPISECNHLKTMLCSRFVNFYANLCKSTKHSIRLLTALCKDNLRTTLGNNLHNIALDCLTSVKSLTKTIVKNNMKYFDIPEENRWRIEFVKEILNLKIDQLQIEGFHDDELNEIINFLCTD